VNGANFVKEAESWGITTSQLYSKMNKGVSSIQTIPQMKNINFVCLQKKKLLFQNFLAAP